MHENKVEPVTLTEMLQLWIEKHHPNKPMYFVFYKFLPWNVTMKLADIGISEPPDPETMFLSVPEEHASLMKEIKAEYGNRVCIIHTHELKKTDDDESALDQLSNLKL